MRVFIAGIVIVVCIVALAAVVRWAPGGIWNMQKTAAIALMFAITTVGAVEMVLHTHRPNHR